MAKHNTVASAKATLSGLLAAKKSFRKISVKNCKLVGFEIQDIFEKHGKVVGKTIVGLALKFYKAVGRGNITKSSEYKKIFWSKLKAKVEKAESKLAKLKKAEKEAKAKLLKSKKAKEAKAKRAARKSGKGQTKKPARKAKIVKPVSGGAVSADLDPYFAELIL